MEKELLNNEGTQTMTEKELERFEATLTINDVDDNGVVLTVAFGAKMFMLDDARGLLNKNATKLQNDIPKNVDTSAATVYFTKGNRYPVNVEAFKNTMSKLITLFPDTVFLTTAGANDEETDLNHEHLAFLKEAGCIDFNMFVCYENDEALVYPSPSALPMYEKLVEIYADPEIKESKAESKLKAVKAIVEQLKLL